MNRIANPGMLHLVEDERFYFDAAAATRVINFIERYCHHFEGKFAGQRFILEPLQRQIVSDVFGWKWKSTHQRRFTDVYWEGAVGCGKSPLLAGIGLYGLGWDGWSDAKGKWHPERGAQVYSLAGTYTQAKIVFETGKKFRSGSLELSQLTEAVQREIRHPRSGSYWAITSGEGPGAGCKPSMILADEAHDWPNAAGYDDLHDRMLKREQPLCWVATNSGVTRACFCWQLREKAVAALQGRGAVSLYPIIWSPAIDQGNDFQPEKIVTDDRRAWRDANPLLGITVSEVKTADKCTEAMKDPAEELKFRRLNLCIWPKGAAGRWLNMALWDRAISRFDGMPKDAPIYLGIDGSQCDDLFAVDTIGVVPGRFILDAHFWIPRVTAERYQEAVGIPYQEWAEKGYITLLDEPTISPEVKREIAAKVIARVKDRQVEGIGYDPAYADEVIVALEAAELPCIKIRQGWSVSFGSNELARRLIDGSIAISPNEVLRFCAENCTVKTDERGNIWPIKPNAKPDGGDGYKGTRSQKVDGITAAVTGMTLARKHEFPKGDEFKDHQISVM